MKTPYFDQVRLLVNLLPIVENQTCFALKGGTAINLFVRDMPRLSVDIDLAYLPVEGRDQMPEAQILPAIQWKQLNLERMAPKKRRKATHKLEKVLFG